MKHQARILGDQRLLFLLLCILLVLSVVDDYQGWRFLLFGFGGVWWLGRWWAKSLAHTLELKREMRFGWAQVGDKLEERFTVQNNSHLPGVWIEIVDHTNLPDYQVSRVTGIEGGATNRWHTSGLCTRRGLYTLGPTMLRTSDPFGLYTVELYDPSSANLMVTPPIVPLPRIEVAPGGRAVQGRPRPNAPEPTVSAASVRTYQPGDDLRWIHWRTSAHHDELYVRLFESTPSGDWWIILDLDQGTQVGEGADSTVEHGVILAASLAERGLRLGRSVGLVVNGKPFTWLPPKSGDGQRWQILHSLASTEPYPQTLAHLLPRIHPMLGKFTSLVVITPESSGSWLEALLPMLWQGAAPTILLLEQAAFGGPGKAYDLAARLAQCGIYHQRITPELLNRPEARPGRRGHWEWRVTPRGRAIAAGTPQDRAWRELA